MNNLLITYSKISQHTKRSFLRFFLSFLIAWIATVIFNDFIPISKLLGNYSIDKFLQKLLILLTEKALHLLQYKTYSEGKFLQIIGSPGIRFEYACLGIRHIMLFSVFIIVYYGKIWFKTLYILAGISLLILVNSTRAVIISVGQHINVNNTQLIHDISTPLLMYLTILILWFIWVNKHNKDITNENKK